MRTIIDKRYLRLVNRNNPLEKHTPDDYNYEDVLVKMSNGEIIESDEVVEKGAKSSIVKTFIEEKTLDAFNALKDDLAKKGFNTRINEAGRTEDKQAFYRKRAEEKSLEYAENYVANPYETEHGHGTAVDVGIFSKLVSKVKNPNLNGKIHKVVRKLVLYPVMHKVATKYGFILRYPVKYNLTDERRKEIQAHKDYKVDYVNLPMDDNGIIDDSSIRDNTIKSSGKEFRKLLVQYNYEPWHLTYVGAYNAEFMTNNKLTMEEYVRLVENYEQYADEFGDDEKCPSLQEFYNLMTIGKNFDDRNM